RALAYLKRGKPGDLPRALEDLNRALTEKPDFFRVYHLRALVHLILGHDAEGLNDLKSYLAKGKPFDEESVLAHEQFARLLRLLLPDVKPHVAAEALRAKYILAATELQKSVRLRVKSSQFFDDLGAVLEGAGLAAQALIAYSRGLELAPRDVKLLSKRGWL